MFPDDLATGTLWDGRYRIQAHLGSGAAAHAVRAIDEHTGATVALKVLNVETIVKMALRPKWPKEPLVDEIAGDAIARRIFSHPSLVPVHHWSRTPRPYSVADFSAHTAPAEFLDRALPSLEDLLCAAREITALCLGLRAHGFVWLDVSVTNVAFAGAWRELRVVDLGSFAVSSEALRARFAPELKRVVRDGFAETTQARRIRLLLRLCAFWHTPGAMKKPAAELRPELAPLAEWLDHNPVQPAEELPLEHWAEKFAITPAEVALS